MGNKMYLIKYKGNCDIIRLDNMKWAEFNLSELIENKEYGVISSMCMQRVFIKKDGHIIADDSGERYRYFKILNEDNQPIYVWDGFFDNCKTL